MSYDIRLLDPVTRETVEVEAPHLMQGGTYALGGTTELWLNVTYNYGKYYRRVMGEEGIRAIYGMTGAESIPILEAAAARLGDDVSDDYWEATEGFEPYAYMRLPVDADGVPIRVGDRVWYVGTDIEITNDDPQQVVGLVTVFAADGIYVMTRDFTDKAIRPEMLTHKAPEPPDSWEKLEEDALKDPCTYFGKFEDQNVSCLKCPHSFDVTGRNCLKNMRLDLVERAKRLAGIEEQEGGKRTAIADKEER